MLEIRLINESWIAFARLQELERFSCYSWILHEWSFLTKFRFAKLVFNHFWSFSVLWMPILKEKACVLEAAGATKSPLSWPGMTMLYTDVHKRKTFSGRQRDILLIRVKLIIEFILSCPLLIFRLWAPKSRDLSQSGKV